MFGRESLSIGACSVLSRTGVPFTVVRYLRGTEVPGTFDIQKCQHHLPRRHKLDTGLPQFSPDIVRNGRRRTFPISTLTPWPLEQGSLGVLQAPTWGPGYHVANLRRSVIWGGARVKVAKIFPGLSPSCKKRKKVSVT